VADLAALAPILDAADQCRGETEPAITRVQQNRSAVGAGVPRSSDSNRSVELAEQSGTKDAYDAHFGWNSAFVHGQWAAVRDGTLTTCLNPLHRLHRVPLIGMRHAGVRRRVS
jgi:hypothetical protein